MIVGSESGELTLAKNPDANGPVVQLGAALVSPEAAKILEEAGEGSLGTSPVLPSMHQCDSAVESESFSGKNSGPKPDCVKDTSIVNDDKGETSAGVGEINHESNVECAPGMVAKECDSDTSKGDSSAHVSQPSTEGGKASTESDNVESDVVKVPPDSEKPGALDVSSDGELKHDDEGSYSETKDGKQLDVFPDAEVNKSKDLDKSVCECQMSDEVEVKAESDSSELVTETGNGLRGSEQEKVSDSGEVEMSDTSESVECQVTTESSPSDRDVKHVALSSGPETSPGVGKGTGGQEVEELQVSDNAKTSLMTDSTSSEADSDSDIFMDAVEDTESHEAPCESADLTAEKPVGENPPLIVIDPGSDTDEEDDGKESCGATGESAESELAAAECVSDRDRFKSASDDVITDRKDQKEVDAESDVEKETTTVLSNNFDEETEDVSEDELNPPFDASAAMSKGKLERTGEGAEADADDEEDEEKGHSSADEEHADPETEESEVDVEEDDDLVANGVEKNPGTALVLDRPELRHDPDDQFTDPYSDARHSGVGEELLPQGESQAAEKDDLEAAEKRDEFSNLQMEGSSEPAGNEHKELPGMEESVAFVEEEATSKDDRPESGSVGSAQGEDGGDVLVPSAVAETDKTALTEQTCLTSDKSEDEDLPENQSKVGEHSSPQSSSKEDSALLSVTDDAEKENVSGDTESQRPKTDEEGEVVKRRKPSGRKSKKSQKSSKRKSTSSVHRSDSYHVANKHDMDNWLEEESKSANEDEGPEADALLEDIQKVSEEDSCQERSRDAGIVTGVKDEVKREDAEMDREEDESQGDDPGPGKNQSITKEKGSPSEESPGEEQLPTAEDTAKQEHEPDSDNLKVQEPVKSEASGIFADDEEEEDGTEYTLDDIDLDEECEKHSDLVSVDSGRASKENLTTDGSDSFVSPSDSEKGFPSESGLGASAGLKASISKDSVISDAGGKVDGTKSEQKKANSRQKGRGGNRPKGFVEELKLPPASEAGAGAKGDSPVPLERKKRSRKSKREHQKSGHVEDEEPEPVKTPDSKGQKSGSGFFKKIFGRN